MKKNDEAQEAATKYGVAKLLESKRYSPSQKDILASVLDAKQDYSHEEVQKQLDTYLKKEVM